MTDGSYRPDGGTLGWWRNRPCASCGHKAKSHISNPGYCVAYSEGELYNSCHCNAFTEATA